MMKTVRGGFEINHNLTLKWKKKQGGGIKGAACGDITDLPPL